MEIKNRVLVSACLLGRPTRYDGKVLTTVDPMLQRWQDQGCIVSFCPELAGGLTVPRLPAEIVGGQGADVMNGSATVRTADGEDVSACFIRGAAAALQAAQKKTISIAILKDGSPSCGKTRIYDGRFSGTTTPGSGVTAALLLAENIAVFTENEIDLARQVLGVS